MDKRAEQILNGLSEEERKQVLSILAEYQNNGKSKQFDDIRYADYKEIPVDIITFIKDRHYLGDAWYEDSGKCKLYPYWERRLKELFPDNISIDYNSAIFTGARGLGKSEMARLVANCADIPMYSVKHLRSDFQLITYLLIY